MKYFVIYISENNNHFVNAFDNMNQVKLFIKGIKKELCARDIIVIKGTEIVLKENTERTGIEF